MSHDASGHPFSGLYAAIELPDPAYDAVKPPSGGRRLQERTTSTLLADVSTRRCSTTPGRLLQTSSYTARLQMRRERTPAPAFELRGICQSSPACLRGRCRAPGSSSAAVSL
ncbi:hypothetical protein C8T65DRAFT_739276 [Cerioporus squamosus]|nr:hypothetical protein C8T65DRAFT_739276 [Cerioporus squamosus]